MYAIFVITFQSLTDDVNRQKEREKILQQKYSDLETTLKELQIVNDQISKQLKI